MRYALLCASDIDLDFSARSHYGGNTNTKITIKRAFNIYRPYALMFFLPFSEKNESKQRSTAVQALTGKQNTNSDNTGDTVEPVNSLLRNL